MKFTNPEMNITKIETVDIITTSITNPGANGSVGGSGVDD